MVVLLNPFGNHCNRLFQNLHLEAFCLENNIEYFNPTFEDIEKYYEEPVSTDYRIRSSLLRTKPAKLLKRIGLLPCVISFDAEDQGNIDRLLKRRNKKNYVEGWGFRAYDVTNKHQELFRKKYSLKREYYIGNETYKAVKAIDRGDAVVVGIHVRRGDYETYAEGAYYYSDSVYARVMKDMEEEIKASTGKKVAFIIFSNDAVGIREAMISCNEWYVDQQLMAMCDYLLGPPSTFTLWASYIGKVPYLHIQNPNSIVRLDDFKLCIG